MNDMRRKFYPEIGAGGYSRADSTIEFYSRIERLSDRFETGTFSIVELGPGRGSYADDKILARRALQVDFRKRGHVIGLDVDEALFENQFLDEAYVISPKGPFPLESAVADFVVADWTFEHVADPASLALEIARILKPGGWLCARTPHKYGVVGLLARIVPNAFHKVMLRRVQPSREDRDSFPTVYGMNTRRRLEELFPLSEFSHFSYTGDSEPAYAGSSRVLWRLLHLLMTLFPRSTGAVLYVFVQKS